MAGKAKKVRLRSRTVAGVIDALASAGSARNRAGMARYGINVARAFGVSIYTLRPLAKELGRDHALAGKLWRTGVHEVRILAGYVDEPEKVTPAQMDRWVKQFDSWDLCDQVVSNLFDRTPHAWAKAVEWAKRDGPKDEFVKRAGFALMAALAVHDKRASDSDFERFFPLIERASTDERNFVKKAVNWALRQIGKRSLVLNRKAATCAKRVAAIDSKSARWIAKDALRELESEKVRKRLRAKR